MRALSLVLLAALCGAALGRDFSPAGRELLQVSSAECNRAVPGCKTCRFQFFRGTVTRAICTQCVTGYVVKKSGQTCACAPGYYQAVADGDCVPCTQGYYCTGSKLTRADAPRAQCTASKTTLSSVAKSIRECVTKPGYGPSGECGIGFYNPGGNNRACTRCPGGLTSTTTTATSPTNCVAPKGSYYLRGKALPCAQGTYKDFEGNADCQKCPDGTTTQFGAVGKQAKSECKFLLPGYKTSAALNAENIDANNVTVTACPANYYRATTSNEPVTDASTATTGIDCTQCPGLAETLPGVEGATSLDACVAPPGTFWANTTAGAVQCAADTYSDAYDRAASCKSCGSGVLTAGPGADSENECYTPEGSSATLIDGTLTVEACPANTYGRPNATYGLLEVECTKCPENTAATGTGNTDISACLTAPGYGYDDGAVNQCDFGTWSTGGSDDACTACPAFYNTTTSSIPTLLSKDNRLVAETGASMGAVNDTQCVVAAGYKFTNGVDNTAGLSPCPRGTYNEWLNYAACDDCPAGVTTMLLSGATQATDCNACQPGYGGSIDTFGTSNCTACASGSYSAGLKLGGADCDACLKPENFTGFMVSRPASQSPDACVPQFPSDGDLPSKYTWDLIAPSSSDVATVDAATTQGQCQTACGADCMYFVWSEFERNVTTSTGYQVGKCFLYTSSATDIDAAPVTVTAAGVPSGPVIMLEAKAGVYIAYPVADTFAANIGGTALTSSKSLADARADCDANPLCVGIANSDKSASGWRTFGAGLYPDVQTKVKAYSNQINPWALVSA